MIYPLKNNRPKYVCEMRFLLLINVIVSDLQFLGHGIQNDIEHLILYCV